MEVRDVIITHVLGPAALLFLVSRYRPISRLDAVLTAVAVGVPFAFLWLAGRWHLASVWGRPVLAVGILVMIAICWQRARRLPLYASSGVRSWLLRTVKIALAGYVLVQLAAAVAGQWPSKRVVSLEFPLRGDSFYVGQGGSTAAVNYHVVNRTQQYALDITKLTAWGNRASGFRPHDLREYASYGTAVYAPCAGRIQHDETAMPDNAIAGEVNRARPAGNHVLLRCDGTDVDVLMAHLQRGSVQVRAGDHVPAGARLGAIGNSGNSGEPHLHIHARRGGTSEYGRDGEGVPMVFNGNFLTRNAIVSRP